MKRLILLASLLCVMPFACLAASQADTGSHYHLARKLPIPGDDGWDYLTFDKEGGRLFIAHGTRVQSVDADKLIVTGEIPETLGVHGVAIAQDLGRGYISAGRANSVIVFDLKSLAVIATIKTSGENPDAVLYEPTTHRVFTFNGRGRNVTAIDTTTNAVIGTIPVGSKPEFAVTDGAGHVYVNLEDKNSLAVIDPKKLTVTSVWPVTGCEGPTGLAMDAAHHRLFSVCDKTMVVLDANSGHVLATLPIGDGVDAAAYDPGTHLAFASGGDGTLTIVKETSPDKFTVLQTVKTAEGARTMTLDERTHRIFLVTAKLAPKPPTPAGQKQRPAVVPGSFELLVVEP